MYNTRRWWFRANCWDYKGIVSKLKLYIRIFSINGNNIMCNITDSYISYLLAQPKLTIDNTILKRGKLLLFH